MIFLPDDFAFKRWTVLPLVFYTNRVSVEREGTYRDKWVLEHDSSHLIRHLDRFSNLFVFLDGVSLVVRVLDNRLQLSFKQGINHVEEVSLLKLLTFGHLVWEVWSRFGSF